MILSPHLFRCPKCSSLTFKKEVYVSLAKDSINGNTPVSVEEEIIKYSCSFCKEEVKHEIKG